MQNLILDWLPPPHVASQLDQTVNLVQTPFAEFERNYQDMSLLYLSYDIASGSEIMPLKYGFYKPQEVKTNKETSAQARDSFYKFLPPEVYKFHIFNIMIQYTVYCMYLA